MVSLPITALALVLAAPPASSEADAAPTDATSPEPAPEPAAETTTEPRPAAPPAGEPWLTRWAPERTTVELGVFGGMLLPSRRIELFEADYDLPDQGYKPLAPVFPELGLRAGYYSTRFFGLEAEAGVMPGRTEAGDRVLLYTGRGSLVGQLGLWSVTPFVLIGAGLLGVSSDRSVLGNDVDASMHFGGGLKVHATRLVQVRLDVRDIIAARRGYNEGVVHNAELLLGVSITLGRRRRAKATAPPATDTDGDGVLDADDACKDRPGASNADGCPRSDPEPGDALTSDA